MYVYTVYTLIFTRLYFHGFRKVVGFAKYILDNILLNYTKVCQFCPVCCEVMLTLRVYSLPRGMSSLVYIPEHVACLQVATYILYMYVYMCASYMCMTAFNFIGIYIGPLSCENGDPGSL